MSHLLAAPPCWNPDKGGRPWAARVRGTRRQRNGKSGDQPGRKIGTKALRSEGKGRGGGVRESGGTRAERTVQTFCTVA